MSRPEVIRRRLQKVDEHLGILEELRCYDLNGFLANPEREVLNAFYN